MKARKSGDRHPLLFYRRTMDRVWKAGLFLGILLAAAGSWALVDETSIFKLSSDIWLFTGAIVAFALGTFAFFSRYLAYVQAHSNYFSVATPFMRLRISYRRVLSTHPVLMQQLFPPNESSWAQRSFLEPFYGKTAVVIELRGYPLDPVLLRLFFPVQMFSPRSPGLVIMVPDWMKLSTELDSLYGNWVESQRSRARTG